MNKRTTLLLIALIAVALLAVLPPIQPTNADEGVGMTEPSAPDSSSLRGLPRARVERTSHLHLFPLASSAPERSDPASAPQRPTSSPVVASGESLKLLGYSGSGTGRFAIVEVNGRAEVLASGKSLTTGHEATHISATCITLTRDDESIRLALTGFTCE